MVFFFYMSNVLVWGGMDAVGGKSRRVINVVEAYQ